MILQKQLHPWSCTTCAFAMVLGVSEQQLIEEIGFDGGEIIWPESRYQWRGIHIQEVMDVCWKKGFLVLNIEVRPILGDRQSNKGYILKDILGVTLENRLEMYLMSFVGVINDGIHLYAWDGRQIYDPRGSIWPEGKFPLIKNFYPVVKYLPE